MTSPGTVIQHHRDLQSGMISPEGVVAEFIHSLGIAIGESYANEDDENAQVVVRAFFAPYRPDKSSAEAAKFAQEVGQNLVNAKSYLVTSEMVEAITAMYQQAEGWKHLELREMPDTNAFVWLEEPFRPLSRRSGSGPQTRKPIRAISWYKVVVRTRESGRRQSGVRICFWHYDEDYASSRSSLSSEERAMWDIISVPTGGLTLGHTCVMLFGVEFPGCDGDGDSIVAWLKTLWMFLGMEIVSQNPVSLDRASRRRLGESQFRDKKVNVVMLRRISHQGHSSSRISRSVEWAVQWLVQGHWRHLESYEGSHHHGIPRTDKDHPPCSVCGKVLTWVKPFIKGPDGKPLKITEQLFKLAR